MSLLAGDGTCQAPLNLNAAM
ncbi:hypothetical protein PIIN_11631 [Serendipita indica DSM 11827]|uniref:Uncharacterized protein n=1 Tax=Serendipita indica (strain DSM 11827) TaxID=1109443 RepID=G4U260_SERID|nr:hypothetical protein PIIN_11631 [Serendipita indica DSM 11827]